MLADLMGKGGHIRTVRCRAGQVRRECLDEVCEPAKRDSFPSGWKNGKVRSTGFIAKVIWSIVSKAAADCGFGTVAPHDLRRTCARPCHQAGGELEQIQFLLGHVSVQTTERYLGCKQRLQNAVNDHIGLEPP